MAPDELFYHLKAVAITSIEPLSSRFPFINTITDAPGFDLDRNYNYYLVVAGIWFALDHRHGLLEGDEEASALVSIAMAWDRQVEDSLQDVDRFIEIFDKDKEDLITAIGAWVVWNLKGSKLESDEEFKAAHAIGFLLRAALLR